MKRLIALSTILLITVGCTQTTTTTTPSTSPTATPMASSSMAASTAPMVMGVVSEDYTKPAPATQAEIQTASVPARDSEQKLQDGSLYSRLGGIKAIRPVTHALAMNVAADPRISRFFTTLSAARLTNLEQRVVEQLCMATGGPCVYTGEDMVEAHENLNISAAEFDAFIEDAGKTLDQFNVPAKEKGELAAALVSMKDMIINK